MLYSEVMQEKKGVVILMLKFLVLKGDPFSHAGYILHLVI